MYTASLIAPLALICLFGFLSLKTKILEKKQTDALSTVCFNILIPLFLFRSTYGADLSAEVNLGWSLTFYIPVITLFLSLFFINRFYYRQSNTRASVLSLVATYSNTVLIAIPILANLLSLQVASRAFVLIAFHSAVLFTLTEVLIKQKGLNTLLLGVKNPIVISIALGLSFNLIEIPMPELLLTPITMLSQSAIPLALFGLGASMYFLPIRGNRRTALALSIVKLVVLPSLALVLGRFIFNLSQEQLLIACLLLASPTGAAAYLVASKHQQGQDVAATTVVMSTLLSVISYICWIEILT